jgi:hypothetical protein
MVLEERAPALRGWLPPPRHQPRNGPLGDVEPQLQQLPMDARRAPKWVRDGHPPGPGSPADARERLVAWYRERASVCVPERVAAWSAKLGLGMR